MHSKQASTTGFTLLELTTVLTIIGLIVGGLAVGFSLVGQSELRNVMMEKEKYESAIIQFKEKYQGLPGDLYNATSFWPVAASCGWAASSGSTVCNGNGDGKIAADISTHGFEANRAWRQLALAEIIEGSYTGQFTNPSPSPAEPGTRTPATDYYNKALGWQTYYVGPKSADSNFFDGHYKHILFLGKSSLDDTAANKGGMRLMDLIEIEEKFDDGSPVTGQIRSGKESGTFGGSTCINGDTSAATYRTPPDASIISCIPVFLTTID